MARVWIKPGTGKITVNGRDEKIYFARPVLRMILRQPLIAANRDGQFDVDRHGRRAAACRARRARCVTAFRRALVNYEPSLRAALKPGGFLTRDPRAVERKKYGRPKARRSFQFSQALTPTLKNIEQKQGLGQNPGPFFAFTGHVQMLDGTAHSS